MKSTVQPSLGERMRAKADADGLPDSHELRTLAASFDEATLGFYSEPQTCDVKQFLGCWARARRAWGTYTGEPLV